MKLVGQLLELLTDDSSEAGCHANHIDAFIGKSVFIRTVTLYYTGRLVKVEDKFLVLTDAAWIADTGRLSEALISGQFNEVEPMPGPILVAINAIVELSEFSHPLPRVAK